MHQHPGQSIASRIDALVRANSYKMLVNSHCYHLKWAEKKFHSDCHVNKSKHAKDRILASMNSIRRNSYDYIEYVMGNKLEVTYIFFSLFSSFEIHFTCIYCHFVHSSDATRLESCCVHKNTKQKPNK